MSTNVKTECVVAILEVAGEETIGVGDDQPELLVRTHWCHDDRVVIQVDNSASVTVLASSLQLAIQRCSR